MTREEQVQYIRDHYLEVPGKEMARRIGRSSCFVYGVMRKEGLVVPKRILKKRIAQSRFQKGHEPFNKGKKMNEYLSKESMEKMKRTQFKSGQLPSNTKHDGAISLRYHKGSSYFYVRQEIGKWMPLHREIWIAAHGPIPSNHNVQFKDGNSLNVDLSNLYLIDRKTQLRVNKEGGNELPFYLQRTIQLIYQLKLATNEE